MSFTGNEKVKIVLNQAPESNDECPLYRLAVCKHCVCNGGYYDYRTFDFKDCPFCTTAQAMKNKLEF